MGYFAGRQLNQQVPPTADVSLEESPELLGEVHSIKDVEALIKTASAKNNAVECATALATIDSWSFRPDDLKSVDELKRGLMTKLREKIVNEVHEKQRLALASATARGGFELHADAGQILSLYPMSDDLSVLAEAKQLSAEQAEVAVRLDSLRRLRYNSWAVERIRAAIDGYYANSSLASPKKENPKLMKSLVDNLGEVDPVLLEPVPMELYNYVIALTKDSIAEPDKIELAKMLVDPAKKRKGMGDF
ncbi:MAG: hypothetical protein HZA51_04995 [Planctomycetes bacterium]|nr:hypothetical protein [Planctomycetota bacterium]